MNKSRIYHYVEMLEMELKAVLVNNKFSELIIAEIINESIIELHEVSSSSMSDEDTAKSCICRLINSFYESKHLMKVEDKYWNWDQRLSYGFRGRVSATPDNLIRFRHAVDLTRKEVIEEKNAMIHAVKNCVLDAKTKPNGLKLISQSKTLWFGVLCTIFFLIGIFTYAINQRYIRMNSDYVFDKWTGNSIEIYDVLK